MKWVARRFPRRLKIGGPRAVAIPYQYEEISLLWEVVADEQSKEGRRIAIEMRLEDARAEEDDLVEVIGTVEAGYLDPQAAIGVAEAIALARLVARQALDIHRALLPYVLEVIVERVMQIVRANAATLHFLHEPRRRRYVYQVGAGAKGQRLLRTNPLRKGGLGQQVIQAREPRYIPDPTQSHQDLKRLNETIFEQGIRAIAAFPLIIGEREGVLYVYFEHEHRFTQDEIGWAQLLANRAVDAIRHATTYTQMRDRTRQLTTLHSIAHNLVTRPEETSLLRYIAGSALNILAADLVTINEYTESDKRFSVPPDIAGRLIDQKNIIADIDIHSAPTLLVERGTNIYEQQSAVNTILNDFSRPRVSGKDASFVIREKIASSAGILLKVSEEIVGVMFINYRRRHSFSEEEQRIIETLASSAAIAIKNRRLLSLSAVDREIITTLDLGELLNLIVQRAVGITGADLGDIRQLDSVSQQLVVKARHPADAPIAVTLTGIRMGEGITGWVAAHCESLLVNDVPADARHKPYFPNAGSVLCVPLLNRDSRVLGVLTVGSNRLGAFNQRYRRMLEALANQAVIAIQNAENQERLVTARTMATLGDFAGLVVHKMQDDFSAIRVRAREIQRIEDDARKKELAAEIETLAAKVLQQTQSLMRGIPENLRAADIHGMISNALEQIDIPSNIVRQVDFSETLLHVLWNEEQLTDVFMNLIRNAVEAMPFGGTLSISGESVEQEGRYWIVVRVRDTGVGISEENLEHIFKRGYSTKGGLGVGLWLSQAYIEQLDGQISVSSRLRKGTEFTVSLPAFKPQE